MYVHTYIHIYTYVYTYMHRCLLVCVYYLWLTYNWRPIFEGNSGSKASLLRRLFRPSGETLESRQGQQSWGDSFHLNQEFTKQGDLSIFIQQKWGFDYQTWASNMPMFDHTVFESYALTWQNRNRPIYFLDFSHEYEDQPVNFWGMPILAIVIGGLEHEFYVSIYWE